MFVNCFTSLASFMVSGSLSSSAKRRLIMTSKVENPFKMNSLSHCTNTVGYYGTRKVKRFKQFEKHTIEIRFSSFRILSSIQILMKHSLHYWWLICVEIPYFRYLFTLFTKLAIANSFVLSNQPQRSASKTMLTPPFVVSFHYKHHKQIWMMRSTVYWRKLF